MKNKKFITWLTASAIILWTSVAVFAADTSNVKFRNFSQAWTWSWYVQESFKSLESNISKSVTNIDNWVEITLTTTDSETLSLLSKRFTNNDKLNQKNDKISISIETLNNWVKITMTSSDEDTVKKIQEKSAEDKNWIWFLWFGRWEWKNWMNFDKTKRTNNERPLMMMWMMNLTDEEKTSLESMTDDEKKSFFETKRKEFELKQEKRETVIDKLLAGETLTSDEEVIRKEIINQRTEMKNHKIQMDEMKTLIDKEQSWETLTTEEKTRLEELQKLMKKTMWNMMWMWKNFKQKSFSNDEFSTN